MANRETTGFNFHRKRPVIENTPDEEVEVKTTPAYLEVNNTSEGLNFKNHPEKKSLNIKKTTAIITPEMHDKLISAETSEQSSVQPQMPMMPESENKVILEAKEAETEETATERVSVHTEAFKEQFEEENEEEKVIETPKDIIRVDRAFSEWFRSVENRKDKTVRQAYGIVDDLQESNPEVYIWVSEHENAFAEIWLGADFKEIPLYETIIPNNNKKPNYLVKEPSGKVLPKIDAEIQDNDILRLTEEEITENWGYFFEQGLAKCVNSDAI
ncbi:TPA: hypothetical protein ACGWER_001770 [Streptococcus agalactiae]|nr:hypothetical protein [Streptococcus agalactiae]HEO2267418.1 hypothetical protein [Streptococcus agalactiae]HEO7770420.1 hypothetical protein [Streptococcus agalactiae]